MLRVLLADDDADLRDIASFALRREGFAVSLAIDGEHALSTWRAEPPDVILLDVRMPKMDGFQVLSTIRRDSNIPIIMLTACTSEEEVLRGLKLGADDYVVKPYSPRQLAARIRAVCRRAQISAPHAETHFEVAGIVLDLESHEAKRGTIKVRLTPTEFRLIYPLMLNAGRVVAAARLVEHAWGYGGGDSFMLKTHISHIRKRLKLEPGQPGYIENIPSVGYMLHCAS
jgi:DNA-binding response OmpR family regulator